MNKTILALALAALLLLSGCFEEQTYYCWDNEELDVVAVEESGVFDLMHTSSVDSCYSEKQQAGIHGNGFIYGKFHSEPQTCLCPPEKPCAGELEETKSSCPGGQYLNYDEMHSNWECCTPAPEGNEPNTLYMTVCTPLYAEIKCCLDSDCSLSLEEYSEQCKETFCDWDNCSRG